MPPLRISSTSLRGRGYRKSLVVFDGDMMYLPPYSARAFRSKATQLIVVRRGRDRNPEPVPWGTRCRARFGHSSDRGDRAILVLLRRHGMECMCLIP